MCWKETEFDKDTPIELRKRYVHGVANYAMNVGKNSMEMEINKTIYNLDLPGE